MSKPPSAGELIRAHRTLRRLAYSLPYDEPVDRDGRPAFDGITEGRRMLAVATSWLGRDNEDYMLAWEEMMK